MPRLSRAQQEVRQQIESLLGSRLLPQQLAGKLLEALLKAVPADGGGLFGLDPTTLLHNRWLAAAPDSLSLVTGFYRNVYLSGPIPTLLHPGLMRAGLQVVVLQPQLERSLGLPRSLLRAISEVEEYYSFYASQPQPGGSLRASFAADGRWVAQLELIRRDRTMPFRAGDVEFVRLVAPAVARALRAAFDREQAAAFGVEEAGPEAPGVILLAPSGREQLRTPAAEVWLDLLRQSEAGSTGRLPGAVYGVVAGLRAGLDGARHATVRAWTPKGQLRVQAAPADDNGAVSVVLTPEHPPVAPELPAVWPVTGAERRVLELLVRGLSNREIAMELHVSVNTIQTHLAHAYEKLGVQSRNQLLARFFRETYWPTLYQPV
jgi:DNA-binding CsgD family transcriptional regulator